MRRDWIRNNGTRFERCTVHDLLSYRVTRFAPPWTLPAATRSYIFLVHAPKMATPTHGTTGLLPLLKKHFFSRRFSQLSEDEEITITLGESASRRLYKTPLAITILTASMALFVVVMRVDTGLETVGGRDVGDEGSASAHSGSDESLASSHPNIRSYARLPPMSPSILSPSPPAPPSTPPSHPPSRPPSSPPVAAVAFVVRGLIYFPHRAPRGGSLHPIGDHDFLARAWPSMRDHLVQPAKECGFTVDLYITLHPNSLPRLSSEYLSRLRSISSNVTIWTVRPDTHDEQFDLAKAFLEAFMEHFHGETYDLVIMTRDDFVYRPGSWKALSNGYDSTMLNLVSTDCAHHFWDGLHVFPGSATPIFARAFRGWWAHDILDTSDYRPDQLNLWFSNMYAQPDECEPAMGYLDRGFGASIHELYSSLADQNEHARDKYDGQFCCARAHEELDEMPVIRRCPVLTGPVGDVADPLLRCTAYPPGPDDDVPNNERCTHGNELNDGFEYVWNSYRGTFRAACGRKARCACCRRPRV